MGRTDRLVVGFGLVEWLVGWMGDSDYSATVMCDRMGMEGVWEWGAGGVMRRADDGGMVWYMVKHGVGRGLIL